VHAVHGTHRHIQGVTAAHGRVCAVDRDQTFPCDYEPVFGAARVLLVAKPVGGPDFDRLNLEIFALGEDHVRAPGAISMFGHRTIMPNQPLAMPSVAALPDRA